MHRNEQLQNTKEELHRSLNVHVIQQRQMPKEGGPSTEVGYDPPDFGSQTMAALPSLAYNKGVFCQHITYPARKLRIYQPIRTLL